SRPIACKIRFPASDHILKTETITHKRYQPEYTGLFVTKRPIRLVLDDVNADGVGAVIHVINAGKHLPLVTLARLALISEAEVEAVRVGKAYAIDIRVDRNQVEARQRWCKHNILPDNRREPGAGDVFPHD